MQTYEEQQPPKNKGGRPKGSLSERTKMLSRITDQALQKGITPVEVMLDNMRFFHGKATRLLNVIVNGIEAREEIIEQDDIELATKDMVIKMKDLGNYRMQAQKCASDAAPFLHPTLSSQKIEANVAVSRGTLIEATANVDDAAALFMQTMRDPTFSAALDEEPEMVDVTPSEK